MPIDDAPPPLLMRAILFRRAYALIFCHVATRCLRDAYRHMLPPHLPRCHYRHVYRLLSLSLASERAAAFRRGAYTPLSLIDIHAPMMLCYAAYIFFSPPRRAIAVLMPPLRR